MLGSQHSPGNSQPNSLQPCAIPVPHLIPSSGFQVQLNAEHIYSQENTDTITNKGNNSVQMIASKEDANTIILFLLLPSTSIKYIYRIYINVISNTYLFSNFKHFMRYPWLNQKRDSAYFMTENM